MNKIGKCLYGAVFSLALCLNSSADVLLSDFNDGDLSGTFSDSWSLALVSNGSFASIGSPATDFGNYRSSNFTAIDITGNANITITAKLDVGNTATGFTVNLISGGGDAFASAFFDASLFNTDSFTTVTMNWINGGSFNPASLRAWQITGGAPASTDGISFRMSFDNLSVSAVPEPASYAVIVGAMSLGLVSLRRRRASG